MSLLIISLVTDLLLEPGLDKVGSNSVGVLSGFEVVEPHGILEYSIRPPKINHGR